MQKIIDKLKQIKKEGLSEREFYFQVLTVLDGLNEKLLTKENFEVLKDTLLQIGCKKTADWKKEQIENGASEVDIMEYDRLYKGINNASLYEGVNMVSHFLYSVDSALVGEYVMSPGRIYSLPNKWCRRSKMLYGPAPSMEELLGQIKSLNKDSLGERCFYEEVLKCLISTRNMLEMTPDMHRQISDALREIGCQTVQEWKAERESLGKTSDMYKNIKYGINAADLGTAVTMVDKFFTSYDDAVEMSNTVLSGEIPDALNWINNSEAMRDAEMSNILMLQDLLKIDRKSMTERQFYENILYILSMGLNTRFSRDMHKDLKDTLEQIGVKSITEWESDKYTSPEKTVDGWYKNIRGDYKGSLSTGVSLVSTMLGDYDTARVNYELFRIEPGRKSVREWISDSKAVGEKQAVQVNILSRMQERREKRKKLNENAKTTEEAVK